MSTSITIQKPSSITQKNKIINSTCKCARILNWVDDEVIMLNPCEHMIHAKCFEECQCGNIQSNGQLCPYCGDSIKSITKLNDYKTNPELYQKCVDILSVTNVNDMMKISYDDVLFNIPELLAIVAKGMLRTGFKTGWELSRDALKIAGVRIKVSGLEKIKPGPKVFIANHTCHLDGICILYLLRTSFLSSASIRENSLTKKLLDIVPLHTVELGAKSSNTVDNMRDYIEKNESICIFPEGMFTHPSVLGRFRTGAFHIGYPIYPIVLKYQNYMSDTSILDFLLKTHSEKSEFVEFIVMDPFYPPFDDNKIELVRFAMAERGNLLLSRVSNRDINNKKEKMMEKKRKS